MESAPRSGGQLCYLWSPPSYLCVTPASSATPRPGARATPRWPRRIRENRRRPRRTREDRAVRSRGSRCSPRATSAHALTRSRAHDTPLSRLDGSTVACAAGARRCAPATLLELAASRVPLDLAAGLLEALP